MKKIICAAAASMLLATTVFVGCGKDSDSGSSGGFAGKYAAYEMEANGQTLTSFNMLIINVPLEAMFHLDINDDGTYAVSTGLVGMNDAGDDETISGKWEKVDDDTIKMTITVKDEEKTLEVDFDGDKFALTSEMLGEEDGDYGSVKFKRVSEYTTYDASAALSGLAGAFGG